MSCVGGWLAGGKYVVLMWAANREYNERPQERWRRQKEGAKHNSPADGFDDMLNKVENMETWQTHISFYEQGHIRHTWGVNGSQDFCVMDTHTGESLPLFSRKRSAIPLMESSDYSPDRCDDGAGGVGENAFFRTRPHVVYPFTNAEMCTAKGLHCCYVPLLLLLLLFGKRGRRREVRSRRGQRSIIQICVNSAVEEMKIRSPYWDIILNKSLYTL